MSLVTVDSITNGASLLFVALCLRRAQPRADRRGPGPRASSLSSLVLSLSRIAYVPPSLCRLLPAAEETGVGASRARSLWSGSALRESAPGCG